MPSIARKQADNRKRLEKKVTIVRSVDGISLEEYAPGLKNQFVDFHDAFHTIMKHTNKRVNGLKTTRVAALSLA